MSEEGSLVRVSGLAVQDQRPPLPTTASGTGGIRLFAVLGEPFDVTHTLVKEDARANWTAGPQLHLEGG